MTFQEIEESTLELSTKILMKTAIEQAIQVELLDEESNTIRLSKNNVTEIVVQCTRTSKDNYIGPLLMANKHITKLLLKEVGLQVPIGYKVTSLEEGLSGYLAIKDKKMVVKPLSTNFGIGITILEKEFGQDSYKEALIYAFSKDKTILVERYAAGLEYRFLVIQEEVVGILHRVPANVVGDGIHTIAYLVEQKNQDPLRGTGYKTPLEKLKLGVDEIKFLKMQGYTPKSVIEKKRQVFLRKNSNISTGGDSIDMTDQMPEGYKKIAIEATKALNVQVCGVDMMIQDTEVFDRNGYSIIELNYNPAIHIHNFPYKGENREAEKAILRLLGF